LGQGQEALQELCDALSTVHGVGDIADTISVNGENMTSELVCQILLGEIHHKVDDGGRRA
jgi:hypothetical protein